MDVTAIIVAASIPSALTGFFFWLIEQSVQADTFGKTYEDKRFTKNGGILTDSAKCCGCCRGNGNAAADTGKSG